jgi:Uma2 family endonuclease
MGTATRPQPATIEDLLALDPDARVELVRGTLLDKPEASSSHAAAQVSTPARLIEPFQRKPGGRYPGGWWFFTELLVQLGPDAFRPDVCAYRRERMPERPNAPVVKLAPDWICEILSPSHEARDRIEKLQAYFRAGVPHYWIMNAEERTLEVFRRTDIGYALVLTARRGDRVRAEPFDAVELAVDELFGDDPVEPPA